MMTDDLAVLLAVPEDVNTFALYDHSPRQHKLYKHNQSDTLNLLARTGFSHYVKYLVQKLVSELIKFH